jgi:crotonobetainyl-CoA:carnitine CoA-transferase CaiB-like acyl-CoA transferase
VRGPAPRRGEHNHEVLKDWLGKTAAQVNELIEKEVLGSDV